VERVREVDHRAPALVPQRDELLPLERLQRAALVVPEQPRLDRRSRGDQLQQPRGRRGERRGALRDEVREPQARADGAVPVPQPVRAGDPGAVAQQLAQEQGVAAGALPQGGA
jgi:hypothetical protein